MVLAGSCREVSLLVIILPTVPLSLRASLSLEPSPPRAESPCRAPGWNTNENVARGSNLGSLPGQLDAGEEKRSQENNEAGKCGTWNTGGAEWTRASECRSVRACALSRRTRVISPSGVPCRALGLPWISQDAIFSSMYVLFSFFNLGGARCSLSEMKKYPC